MTLPFETNNLSTYKLYTKAVLSGHVYMDSFWLGAAGCGLSWKTGLRWTSSSVTECVSGLFKAERPDYTANSCDLYHVFDKNSFDLLASALGYNLPYVLVNLLLELVSQLNHHWKISQKSKSQKLHRLMGHFNEYPTMHCFEIPRHAQSMITFKILIEYFWKFQWKIALWECC